MPRRSTRPPIVSRRARGFTSTQLLSTVVAGMALGAFVVFVVQPGPKAKPRRSAPVAAPVRPVLAVLQHDVDVTAHALTYDTDGCGHQRGQRAVVSFLADGSAPLRASWYVVSGDHGPVLLRRECRNGTIRHSDVITAVSGSPLVACTPSCGRFESVRFSYTGPEGLSSIVAYRKAAP